MADIPENLRYLIEALRTPARGHTVTPQTGPNAGIPRSANNDNLGPIEQRRDGYRQYLQEHNSGLHGNGEPLSYQEWISKEQ